MIAKRRCATHLTMILDTTETADAIDAVERGLHRDKAIGPHIDGTRQMGPSSQDACILQ